MAGSAPKIPGRPAQPAKASSQPTQPSSAKRSSRPNPVSWLRQVREAMKPAPVPSSEKNLLVVHNLRSENIPKVAEHGLASPSLAIVHKDVGMYDFGDVTLVAHPSKINPRKDPVYTGDAYTPRFTAEVVNKYPINQEKYKAFKENIGKELHDAIDKQSYANDDNRQVAHNRLDEKLRDMFFEIEGGRHDSPGSVAQFLYLYARMSPDRAKEVASSIFDPPKKYVVSNDTSNPFSIEWDNTPETRAKLVKLIRGKKTILGAEYGGLNESVKEDPIVAADLRLLDRVKSKDHLRRIAATKLNTDPGKEYDQISYFQYKPLRPYAFSFINRFVIEALKRGIAPSEMVVKLKGKMPGRIKEIPPGDWAEVGAALDQYVKDKKAEKSNYFEAKPQRFMDLKDFSAAVVPQSKVEELEPIFAQHGVKVVTYPDWLEGSTNSARRQVLRRVAEQDDLLMSEHDVGLEELAKSELAEELEAELFLEESFGSDQIRKEQEVIVSPGRFERHLGEIQKSEQPIEVQFKCVLTIVQDGIGHMLFIKRHDNGKWSVPAGHLEEGEDPEAGARREIKEETGLEPTYLTRIYESKNPNLVCFSAHCTGTPTNRNDPDQEGKAQWVDVRGGIPSNVWDNLAGPDDETNVVRQLFTEELGVKKSEQEWLDAGFMDLNKAIADIPVGKRFRRPVQDPGGYTKPIYSYDYSHLLSPEQKQAGYSLKLHKIYDPTANRHALVSAIYHNGNRVGQVFGALNANQFPDLRKEHQGKGLAVKAYEALFAHAKHKEGIKQVNGWSHSAQAHNVHVSLARRYGLEYHAVQEDGSDQWYGSYGYALKSELVKKESAEVPHPGKARASKTQQAKPADKNLLVVHNATAENLQHAHELGGLAAPSLAIHRKDGV